MPQEQDIGGWVETSAGVEFDIDGVVERDYIVTPVPTWSYGQSVLHTDATDVTDDTEQWSYGERHSSFVSTYVPVTTSQALKVSGLLLGVYNHG
jgi:hypothetical protein